MIYDIQWESAVVQFSLGHHNPYKLTKVGLRLPYKYCGLVIDSPSLTLEIPYLHNLHSCFMSESVLKNSLDWNNNISGSSALLEIDRCAEPHRFPVAAMTLIPYDYSQWLS
jgi:hypothetical protein